MPELYLDAEYPEGPASAQLEALASVSEALLPVPAPCVIICDGEAAAAVSVLGLFSPNTRFIPSSTCTLSSKDGSALVARILVISKLRMHRNCDTCQATYPPTSSTTTPTGLDHQYINDAHRRRT